MDLVAGALEAGPPTEVDQVDHERALDDMGADPLEQRDRGDGSTAGGDQVVDDDHALAGGDAVDVDLDTIAAVLELVLVADRGVRQLARLAGRGEAGPDLGGDRGAEDEAARLHRGDLVDLLEVATGEGTDHLTEAGRVCQERGDIAKPDPWPGKVRDRADQLLDAVHEHVPLRRTSPVIMGHTRV